MAEKNYRSLSLKYLIIPILVLTLLFSFLSYKSIDLIEDYFCKEMQNETQKIARGYSYSLEKGLDANLLFDDLLREKLTATSQIAALLGKNYTEDISQLATFLNIDDIHIYDNEGVIVNSTNKEYIGWTAEPGHPVYNFMEGSQISLVEEIRPDSETGINYKYAYFKNLDGSFIQVGIKAENILALLSEFSLAHLMTEIQEITNIERMSYFDNDLNLEASSAENIDFNKDEIRQSLQKNKVLSQML